MEALFEMRDVHVGYGETEVLRGVDLRLPRQGSLGLVGESGCGKSTLARTAAGLLRPWAGDLLWNGAPFGGRRDRSALRRVQMVFQDPEGSLNPRHTAGQAIMDAMRFHGMATREDAREKCLALLRRVELPERVLERYPRDLSGGQKQRVALARALAVEPELLIADEPTSALDVSVQRSMLDLIRGLRAERGLTLLFISHDLGVVRYVCDSVAVMREGRILESGPATDFFRNPATEYGRQLLDSVPRVDFGAKP